MAAVEGIVDVGRKEKVLRRGLDSNFRLFSHPPSIENSVVDRKAMPFHAGFSIIVQSIPRVPIPPRVFVGHLSFCFGN